MFVSPSSVLSMLVVVGSGFRSMSQPLKKIAQIRKRITTIAGTAISAPLKESSLSIMVRRSTTLGLVVVVVSHVWPPFASSGIPE